MKKTTAALTVAASAVFSYLIITTNPEKMAFSQEKTIKEETLNLDEYEIKNTFQVKDFANLKLAQLEDQFGEKSWHFVERKQRDTKGKTSLFYIDALDGELLSIDIIQEEKQFLRSSTYTHVYSGNKILSEKMALPEIRSILGEKDTYKAKALQKILDQLNGKVKDKEKAKKISR